MSSKYIWACHRKVPNKVSRWFIWWLEASDPPSLPCIHLQIWWTTDLRAIQGVLHRASKTQQWLHWEMMRTKNNNCIIFTKTRALERREPVLSRKRDMLFFKSLRGKHQNHQSPLGVHVSGLHMNIQTSHATLQGNVTKPKDLRQGIQ